MEAVQFNLSDKKLELVKIQVPKITNPDDVLIKVAFSGICGTDLHIIEGHFPCKPDGPFTLGHEFSGTVVEVGDQVETLKKGDKVSVDPNIGCGKCKTCHEGDPHYCKAGGINTTIGLRRNGGWADYAVCPENQVHKLPDSISLPQAALCEPLSCLSHGWDLASPVKIGKKILITGAGIIGNLWAALVHVHGHKNVTVSEPNQTRLQKLAKLDLGYELITPDRLKNGKYTFDFVIECSGFPPAAEHALTLLNPGGKLLIFGVAPPHGRISVSPYEIYAKELTIMGVNINPYSFPSALGLIESMGERYLNYESLGIKTYSLKEYKDAIAALKQGLISKAIFKI